MSSLDPKVAVHQLAVKNGAHPIQQVQRHFRLELIPCVENEIKKLIETRFIWEVKYPYGF